jgi:hypothetical protein
MTSGVKTKGAQDSGAKGVLSQLTDRYNRVTKPRRWHGGVEAACFHSAPLVNAVLAQQVHVFQVEAT